MLLTGDAAFKHDTPAKLFTGQWVAVGTLVALWAVIKSLVTQTSEIRSLVNEHPVTGAIFNRVWQGLSIGYVFGLTAGTQPWVIFGFVILLLVIATAVGIYQGGTIRKWLAGLLVVSTLIAGVWIVFTWPSEVDEDSTEVTLVCKSGNDGVY